MASSIDDCILIDLETCEQTAGSLTLVDNGSGLPFEVRRLYYLYDVPGGATRGGHAHRELEQFLVAIAGSFDVILDDGAARKTVKMNRCSYGLYIPRLMWRELVNFSTGAICLALASLPYAEDEYLRDYDQFVALKRARA